MIITFFSNYLTHHQIPFCNELSKQENIQFYFVSTQQMEEERKNGGWMLERKYDYELKTYISCENEAKARELALISDVVIIGSAPEHYVTQRMRHSSKQLTFRYSERIYKKGRWRACSPRGIVERFKTYYRHIGKPLYMLCASSYTASDLAILGSYVGMCYKWGYFPEKRVYDNFNHKKRNRIVWAGRFIECKHPEKALHLANKLKEKKLDFEMRILGSGPMKKQLEQLLQEYNLEEAVSIIEGLTSAQVRDEMEQAGIFIATSDYQEGWGAVINEAMNSGCAVVASRAMGSVGYLIEHEKNGFCYSYNKALEKKYVEYVSDLLVDWTLQENIGQKAYEVINQKWNSAIAAERFVNVCTHLLVGEKRFYEEGPCSKA